MKILILNSGSFPYPSANGCSVQLYSIIEAFIRHDNEVILYNFNTKFEDIDPKIAINNLEKKGVKCFLEKEIFSTFQPSNWKQQFTYFLKDASYEFYNGLFHQKSVDKLISIVAPNLIFGYTLNAALSFNFDQHQIPFVLSIVDIDSLVIKFRFKYSNHKSFISKFFAYLRYKRSRNLDKLLISIIQKSLLCFEHAHHHKIYLEKLGANNVIYYPVNVLGLQNNVPYLNKESDKINLALIGNVNGIATLSGLVDFIDNYLPYIAKDRVLSKCFVFNIYGGGIIQSPYLEKLKSFDTVNVKGFVEDVETIYAENDIIFVPTNIPLGFRTRIVESFSYGKCVITHLNNAIAFPEFEHNINGLHYDNVAKLLEVLSEIAQDKSIIERISKNARDLFLNSINGEIIGERMYNDILKALDNKKEI